MAKKTSKKKAAIDEAPKAVEPQEAPEAQGLDDLKVEQPEPQAKPKEKKKETAKPLEEHVVKNTDIPKVRVKVYPSGAKAILTNN